MEFKSSRRVMHCLSMNEIFALISYNMVHTLFQNSHSLAAVQETTTSGRRTYEKKRGNEPQIPEKNPKNSEYQRTEGYGRRR